jgi:hypothetical protein
MITNERLIGLRLGSGRPGDGEIRYHAESELVHGAADQEQRSSTQISRRQPFALGCWRDLRNSGTDFDVRRSHHGDHEWAVQLWFWQYENREALADAG